MKQSKETIIKRHKRLISLLQDTELLRVSEASRILNVSEITIRRDLDELAEQGVLHRIHGGARLPPSPAEGLAPSPPEDSVLACKRRIAKVTAELIPDHSAILLNGGVTTLEVIRFLICRPVRVVTNNARAIPLGTAQGMELICTGGEYNSESQSFVGELATPIIGRVYADLCVLGVRGVSSTHGLTTLSYKEAAINELMINRCNGKRIIVADGSKVGNAYGFTGADFARMDILVTDSTADPMELNRIRSHGVQIILAD